MEINAWSKTLLDSISTGICILDKEYRVLSWNDYLQSYTGVEFHEIEGRVLWEFFPLFGESRYRERIDNIFKGWPPIFYSSRLNRLFSKRAWEENDFNLYQDVSIASLPTDSPDVFLALVTVNDVTDLSMKLEERNQHYKTAKEEIEIRKKVESRLLASEAEYRNLNDTKNKLLSIIAHDLRSPISANLKGLEALYDTYENTSDINRKEMIRMMVEGTGKTYNLMEDLLTWARLHADNSDIFKTAFLLRQMIEYELGKLLHVSDNKGIEIIYSELEEAMVEADRNMIQTVLRNLVSNAIKFTMHGGKIEISSRIEDEWVHVSIKDNGLGMEEEVMNKLFKLEKLHSTRGTANEKGTGFGLILVKEFIEKNKGKISVESTKGEGSTFTFSLPVFQDHA